MLDAQELSVVFLMLFAVNCLQILETARTPLAQSLHFRPLTFWEVP